MDNTFAFDDFYMTRLMLFGQFGQSAKFGLPYTLSMSCGNCTLRRVFAFELRIEIGRLAR